MIKNYFARLKSSLKRQLNYYNFGYYALTPDFDQFYRAFVYERYNKIDVGHSIKV